MRARGAAALFFTIATAVAPFSNARADVYVSEFLALNSASITDEDADHSDWIEIYNGNPAPAAVGVGGPVPPPSDVLHALDYHKCHRIKAAADSPRYFPRQVKLRARDEFEEREYDFRRPSRLCNPASVDGRAFKAATRSLLCYQARRSRGMPQHDPRLGLQVASPLGTARLATREVAEICVPAH